ALILVAATDFARVFYMSIELNNAARAGVQYGAQNPVTAANLAGMKQAAINDAADVTGMTATASLYCECPGGSAFSCSASNSCSDKRVYVEVDTSGTYQTLFSYPWIPSKINLSGKAVMREQ